MRKNTPGFFRVLALLMAVLTVFSLFPMPTVVATASDNGITAAASTIKQNMIDSDIFQALLYLGYDSTGYMRNNDKLFEDGWYGGSLAATYRTNIGYASDGSGTGLQTSTSNTGYLSVTSATGKYPNVRSFEKSSGSSGLDCVDFVAYFVTNYTRNIVGADLSKLDTILASMSGYTYDNMYFWPSARSQMEQQGLLNVYTVTGFGTTNSQYDGRITKYTDPDGHTKTDNIYDSLLPGTVVLLGNPNDRDTITHYGVYVGTYDGNHFYAHCGNNRGPEIQKIEYSSPLWNANNDKASVPLYFYEMPFITQEYGSIEIHKKGNDGKNLAGAGFMAQHIETGIYYDAPVTNASGYTKFEDLPLGTYTITETVFPTGYQAPNGVSSWTVTIDSSNPNITYDITNELITRELRILKSTNSGGTLTGWKFNIYADNNGKLGSLLHEVQISETVTTGAGNTYGKFYINLPPGNYWVKEVGYKNLTPEQIAANGWVMDSEAKKVTVSLDESVTPHSHAERVWRNRSSTRVGQSSRASRTWRRTDFTE